MLQNKNPYYLAGYIGLIWVTHLWIGWVAAVFLITISSGWFWRFKTGWWTALTGLLVTGFEMIRIYLAAPDATSRMIELSGRVLQGYPDYTLVVVSLLLPVIFYYLAGVFSCHIYEIIRKIWY